MFNIINTLYPDYLAKVMEHASKQRMTAEGDDMKKQSIEMSEFWADQLRQMPYLSRKYYDLSTLLPFSSFY